MGLFLQDKWTLSRLTLNLGVRYDFFESYATEGDLGPVPLAPTRSVHFDQTPIANWKDVVPRLGASYDVFGKGKTAVKAGLAKYVIAQGIMGTLGDNNNPINQTPLIVTRNWTDANANFSPDCNLLNPLQQDLRTSGGDFCGTMSDVNFGTGVRTSLVDPNVLNGWGTRPYQWEFSTSVQHELAPRVS